MLSAGYGSRSDTFPEKPGTGERPRRGPGDHPPGWSHQAEALALSERQRADF